MKLVIAGSRHLTVTSTDICSYLDSFGIALQVKEVVSGCADGIDKCGEQWAKDQEPPIPIEPFPANWKKYGRSAGPRRNSEMGDYGDALLLIWDGKSPGSGNMKQQMIQREKPVYEVVLASEYKTSYMKTYNTVTP